MSVDMLRGIIYRSDGRVLAKFFKDSVEYSMAREGVWSNCMGNEESDCEDIGGGGAGRCGRRDGRSLSNSLLDAGNPVEDILVVQSDSRVSIWQELKTNEIRLH